MATFNVPLDTSELELLAEALLHYHEFLTEDWCDYGYRWCYECGEVNPDQPCNRHAPFATTAWRVHVLRHSLVRYYGPAENAPAPATATAPADDPRKDPNWKDLDEETKQELLQQYESLPF